MAATHPITDIDSSSCSSDDEEMEPGICFIGATEEETKTLKELDFATLSNFIASKQPSDAKTNSPGITSLPLADCLKAAVTYARTQPKPTDIMTKA